MAEKKFKSRRFEVDIFDLIICWAENELDINEEDMDHIELKKINPAICGKLVGKSELPPSSIEAAVRHYEEKEGK